jgi:hypothetical protein
MAKINTTANPKTKPISIGLIILMVLTIGVTIWTATHDHSATDDDSVQLATRVVTQRHQGIQNDSINLEESPRENSVKSSAQNRLIPWDKLKRNVQQMKPNDVFKVHSWIVVPPVKKIKPAPPPPPVAPPAPFVYMGKLEDTPKGTLFFLMANNKLYSVVKGEKIDPLWRLDGEDMSSIHLTYIPLGLTQLLSKSARGMIASTPETPVENNL